MVYCGVLILHAMILMLGSLTFGYVLGYPSPTIPEIVDDFNLATSQTTIFNSISSLTAIAGPFIAHAILYFASRRLTTFIISTVGALFWGLLLIMNKKLFWWGILCRAILGIVMGAYSSIIPMYIIEIAPKDHTGFFGTLNNLGIGLGLVLLYLCGNWLHWKVLTIIGCCICGLLMLLVWLVPESPVVKEDVKKESVFQKKYMKGLMIGIAMMFFQQFSCINGILTNLTTLFNKAGINVNNGIASAISSSAQVITIFISSFFVERFGRRPAWCISAAGIVVFLLIYAFSVKFDWGKYAPVAAIFCFLFFYGLGTGPVAWYIVPELFPDSVRSAATSIASSANWLCAFIVIQIFPSLDSAIGTFWAIVIFAIISVGSFIFGFFCVTEPVNNTLDNEKEDSKERDSSNTKEDSNSNSNGTEEERAEEP